MSTSLHKTLLAANLQCEGLSRNQHLRIWIDSLVVVDGHTPLLFFTRSKFLCTRASISFDRYSLFQILFISFSKTTFPTTSILFERGYFSISGLRGDLVVRNVVRFPLHIHNTGVLLSSSSCSRALVPCCSRK